MSWNILNMSILSKAEIGKLRGLMDEITSNTTVQCMKNLYSIKEDRKKFKKNYEKICEIIIYKLWENESIELLTEIENNLQTIIMEESQNFKLFFFRFLLHFKNFVWKFGESFNKEGDNTQIGKYWKYLSDFFEMADFIFKNLVALGQIYNDSLGQTNCKWDFVVSYFENWVANLNTGTNSTKKLFLTISSLIDSDSSGHSFVITFFLKNNCFKLLDFSHVDFTLIKGSDDFFSYLEDFCLSDHSLIIFQALNSCDESLENIFDIAKRNQLLMDEKKETKHAENIQKKHLVEKKDALMEISSQGSFT